MQLHVSTLGFAKRPHRIAAADSVDLAAISCPPAAAAAAASAATVAGVAAAAGGAAAMAAGGENDPGAGELSSSTMLSPELRGSIVAEFRCGASQHRLSSNTMALTISDCGAMRP